MDLAYTTDQDAALSPTVLREDDGARANERTAASEVTADLAPDATGVEGALEETHEPLESVFDRWFGSSDATCVRFTGELKPAAGPGSLVELHLDGEPMSRLIDPEDLPYYTQRFLPRLLRGNTTWEGTPSDDGGVAEGCVALRRGRFVELTYGARVSGERARPPEDTEDSRWTESRGTEAFPAAPGNQVSRAAREAHATWLDLDDVLGTTPEAPDGSAER